MTEDLVDLTTDEALLSSLAEHKVAEIKLEPFSLLRQAISTDLCDEAAGSFFNAVMTVWVCTLSPGDALRAHQNMIAAKIKAFEWAEAQGWSMSNFGPLLEAYGRLNREFAASTKARIKPVTGENGEEIPNAGGQPA